MYKVLTLYQPWATLFAAGIKKIETRPKSTTWIKADGLFESGKGTYLIHAAQKWSKEQRILFFEEPFFTALISFSCFEDGEIYLPLGAIIGSVDIIDCIEINKYYSGEPCLSPIRIRGLENLKLSDTEIAFGDYKDGRYAWIGKNHRLLVDPIPYKNGQGYYQNFKGDESKLIFK